MKNNRQFLFLRHGETDWNLLQLLQGQTDRPLSARGLEQARSAARMLVDEQVGLIVASPLCRARQTALVVSKQLGIAVQYEPSFVERCFGSFEGMAISEVMQRIVPESDLQGRNDHTGLGIVLSTALPLDSEPLEEFCHRVLGAADKWLERQGAEKILFVSHFGVMSVLGQKLCGTATHVKNAVPYRFVPGDDQWRMLELGDRLEGAKRRAS